MKSTDQVNLTVPQQGQGSLIEQEVQLLLNKRAVSEVYTLGSNRRGLLLNTVLGAQKGGSIQTSDQPAVSKQIYEGEAFQDGGNAHCEGFSPKGRLKDNYSSGNTKVLHC